MCVCVCVSHFGFFLHWIPFRKTNFISLFVAFDDMLSIVLRMRLSLCTQSEQNDREK